jgi:hypothetical protein
MARAAGIVVSGHGPVVTTQEAEKGRIHLSVEAANDRSECMIKETLFDPNRQIRVKSTYTLQVGVANSNADRRKCHVFKRGILPQIE